jgi:hypothetical protein
MYSVLVLSMPVVTLPIHGQISRRYIARRRNPDAKVRLGWRTQVWIYGVIVTAGLWPRS